MSVENIGPCGCCGGGCDECSTADTLHVSGPGGSGTLTIDGGDPNLPPNGWHGFVGSCEVWVFCELVDGEIEYRAQVASIVCVLPQDVEVSVNACNPLDLTIHVDTCCTNGDWNVSE